MTEINVQCDRCKNMINGIEDIGFTGGFYRKSWDEFYFKNNENIICDNCMWKDPLYIQTYGNHN